MDSHSEPKRNEIYIANLPKVGGSIQYGLRPVVIVQNDTGNSFSSTVIIAPITSRIKPKLPTHAAIDTDTGIHTGSIILCEQIRTINKINLRRRIGQIEKHADIQRLNRALRAAFDL
ncbi:MAG TPA: PemK family transcriptional regulator [Ruminococcaceae bacterium]|jgi:mRNA interferase MazF|nr:PemK family transcriptional regulator [Oscillospiraceae bacterium]